MARVEIPAVVLNPTTGLPVNGASVLVYKRGGPIATWYSAETGGTSSTSAITTDANGRVNGWVDQGAYTLSVTGMGITSYTEPWDAVPALSYDASTVASGLSAAKFTVGTIPWQRFSEGNIRIIYSNILNGFSSVVPGAEYTISQANGSGSATHQGRRAYVFWATSAVVLGTTGNVNVTWKLKRSGTVISSVAQNGNTGGEHIGVMECTDAGVLSGAYAWTVVVETTGDHIGIEGNTNGLLAVFEV